MLQFSVAPLMFPVTTRSAFVLNLTGFKNLSGFKPLPRERIRAAAGGLIKSDLFFLSVVVSVMVVLYIFAKVRDDFASKSFYFIIVLSKSL